LYKTNPYTLEELRNNLCREISTIRAEELQMVNNNVFHSCTECIWSGGKYFQHLL